MDKAPGGASVVPSMGCSTCKVEAWQLQRLVGGVHLRILALTGPLCLSSNGSKLVAKKKRTLNIQNSKNFEQECGRFRQFWRSTKMKLMPFASHPLSCGYPIHQTGTPAQAAHHHIHGMTQGLGAERSKPGDQLQEPWFLLQEGTWDLNNMAHNKKQVFYSAILTFVSLRCIHQPAPIEKIGSKQQQQRLQALGPVPVLSSTG